MSRFLPVMLFLLAGLAHGQFITDGSDPRLKELLRDPHIPALYVEAVLDEGGNAKAIGARPVRRLRILEVLRDYEVPIELGDYPYVHREYLGYRKFNDSWPLHENVEPGNRWIVFTSGGPSPTIELQGYVVRADELVKKEVGRQLVQPTYNYAWLLIPILVSPILTMALRGRRWLGVVIGFGSYIAYEGIMILSHMSGNIRVDLLLIVPVLACNLLLLVIYVLRARLAEPDGG